MTFPIRKSARKLTGIVKITIPEVFPEMKPLGNVIIFPVSPDEVECAIDGLVDAAKQAGLSEAFVESVPSFISREEIHLHHSHTLKVHDSTCLWRQHYPVMSFLMSGQLHCEYERLAGLLSLPSCSNTLWTRIVNKLEEYVSKLAEWSCNQVRKEVLERSEDKELVASFDGFYLTRGHYSINSSATLHDHSTGKVA